ncbi:heterokaryon incompatibility protein-domain-containing protein [Xylariales sp. PMI_506]|nr:heterokaryon incompatibility protein-domain-containing protein [Xylariales sp. PMI_506]
MRLLNAHTLEFEEVPNCESKTYAILSHTWGSNELSYQDMLGYQRRQKAETAVERSVCDMLWPNSPEGPGLDKIRSCARQALKDNINHIWVDTCCIDKSSSAELQESINSMFTWYLQARVCYAFLSDVSTAVRTQIRNPNSDFRCSRWFTRGWTLQELLAPSEVHFFNSDWRLIGTRRSLSNVIMEITGIEVRWINEFWSQRYSGTSVQPSVGTKMSWAAKRVTSRPEDEAYSLLGIFEIHMPLIYGEGRQAFTRLQREIMKISDDASLLSWGCTRSLIPNLNESNIFAPSVKAFHGSNKIEPCNLDGYPRNIFRESQQVLEITLPVKSDPNSPGLCYGILSCGMRSLVTTGNGFDFNLIAVLPLITAERYNADTYAGDHEYIRNPRLGPLMVPGSFVQGAVLKTIRILTLKHKTSRRFNNSTLSIMRKTDVQRSRFGRKESDTPPLRSCTQNWELRSTYPPLSFLEERFQIRSVSMSFKNAQLGMEPLSRLNRLLMVEHTKTGTQLVLLTTFQMEELVKIKRGNLMSTEALHLYRILRCWRLGPEQLFTLDLALRLFTHENDTLEGLELTDSRLEEDIPNEHLLITWDRPDLSLR